MEFDPSYEYNAPQFVDFDLLKVGQDGGEEDLEDYFKFDHENGQAIKENLEEEISPLKKSPVKLSAPQGVSNEEKGKPLTASNKSSFLDEWKKEFCEAKTKPPAKDTKANPEDRKSGGMKGGLRRSLSMRVPKTSAAGRAVPKRGAQARSSLRRSGGLNRSFGSNTTQESTTSQDSGKRESAGRPANTASSSSSAGSRANTSSSSAGSRANTSTSSTGSAGSGKSFVEFKKPGVMPAMKLKLTMPVTPSFMKRSKIVSSMKSSEQLEMEKIQMLRKELVKKRHQADESHKQSQHGPRLGPMKSQPLTKPEEFHFASDLRLKNQPTSEANNPERKDFASSLRAHPSSPIKSAAHKGPTKPEPFHFSDGHGRKRKHEEADPQSQKYQSMAETMAKYESKTPDRFRSKPQNKEPTPVRKRFRSGDKPRLTMPKTPSLETRSRTRSMHVPSHLDLEEQELEEIRSYKFKAQPVNENIMKPHAVTGVKKVATKEPTKFEGFDLETDRRILTRAEARPKEEDKYEFHANPVPTAILEKPSSLKPVPGIPLTVPESPAFALKQRLRSHIRDLPIEPEETERIVRAKPVPHRGIPFQPKAPQQRATAPQPFSFETRDKRTMENKEKKIQNVYDEEKKARKFKANPIPDHSPVLPPKKTIPLTQPAPFELEAEIRGAQKAEEWSHKVEEELRHQRALANFRAQPNKVVHQEPFIPKKSNRPIEPDAEFQLSTEQRAKERMEYEQWKKEKELESEAQHVVEERRRLAAEDAEVRRLRVEAVPRAKPIRQYKPVEVQPSLKPLTEPQTPHFSTRLRSRSVKS